MNALLEQFLSEGRDLIEEATRELIALERAPDDSELVARVFRAFHTLKGSSGVFDIRPLTRMLHAAEDLLSAARNGRATIDAPLTDALLECLDQTARWLDILEARGDLPDDADRTASGLIERMRHQGHDVALKTAPAQEAPDDLDVFTEDERREALDALQGQGAGSGLFRIVYDPDPRCFFNGEDPLKLIRHLPGLVALRISPREDWPAPEALDPFQCNIRIDALCIGEEPAVRHPFRLVADRMRVASVPPDTLVPAPRSSRNIGDVVGAVLAEQRRLLADGDTPASEAAGRWGSAAASAANALRHDGETTLADTVAAAYREALDRHHPGPLITALDNALQARQSTIALGQEPQSGTALAPLPSSRLLRVDEARIDRLFALASEMIVAKNTLGWLVGQIARIDMAGDLIRPLQELHATVSRLTRDMHDAVIQIRMVPIGQVFERFPRLVRDLSQRLGKPVDLVIEGEGTSADKTVVETLFEPLLHVVRNSLDHGIEPPEERRRHVKPERATLTLRARHVNDRIVIEVADDGRGIDIAAIRRKAVLGNVIDEDQLAALDDAEAARLIFAPGLSTMEETSDLSGRGMGMYAVRMAVERIGGIVGVDTVLHHGTMVRLELPLTLALLRIVTVSASGRWFGIPLDDIAETIRLPENRVQRIRGQSAFSWRDQVVPLHRLGGLLDLGDSPNGSPDGRMVLVVKLGDGIFGLEIDGIADRLEVALRPMDGVLADIPAYLGTTLQGDGQVLLILNLKEILP
jgi:two-component system, chemotaxis family, sensor kinase CheA